MAGNPRIQIVVCREVFERAHARALELEITTSEWLRSLIRAWDGNASILESKQLSVRLDAFHLRRLDRLATRSEVSRSKAFTLLIEKALVSDCSTPSRARPIIPAIDEHEAWAALVIQAAMDTPKKFGEQKAFIVGVLEELEKRLEPVEQSQFRATVKRLLPVLNRMALITLVRADLIPMMNIEWVTASEVTDRIATFHFVDLRQYIPTPWERR